MSQTIASRLPTSRPGRRKGAAGPSVREVCLVGAVRSASTCAVETGQVLRRDGRTYRVERLQRPSGADSRRYVYLAPGGSPSS